MEFGCMVFKKISVYADSSKWKNLDTVMKIDHLMWACSDLDAGIAEIELLSGVKAEYSGSHTGLGTRNALLSLGDDCYLEIIAPDPEQSLTDNFGRRLASLNMSGLLSWAVSYRGLAQLKNELVAKGINTSSIRTTTRENAVGESLTWELLFVKNLVGAPFFIDWLDCVHPAKTSPKGCELGILKVPSSDLPSYKKIFGDIDSLELSEGDSNPAALIQSPFGEVFISALPERLAIF
ncbi:MAG: hypothetical protein ACJAX5_000328 [Patiriisocius sp.]|jgi:hypothetical protein